MSSDYPDKTELKKILLSHVQTTTVMLPNLQTIRQVIFEDHLNSIVEDLMHYMEKDYDRQANNNYNIGIEAGYDKAAGYLKDKAIKYFLQGKVQSKELLALSVELKDIASKLGTKRINDRQQELINNGKV